MKRALCATCLMLGAWGLAAAACAQTDEMPVRDPFWPQGYDGIYRYITCEPRVKAKPKTEPARAAARRKTEKTISKTAADDDARAREAARKAEEARRAEEDRLWLAARNTLVFGGTMGYNANGRHQTAITINGRIYAPDDLVSCNFNGLRFTWKVESVTSGGKLRLKRIKFSKPKTEQKQ